MKSINPTPVDVLVSPHHRLSYTRNAESGVALLSFAAGLGRLEIFGDGMGGAIVGLGRG